MFGSNQEMEMNDSHYHQVMNFVLLEGDGEGKATNWAIMVMDW